MKILKFESSGATDWVIGDSLESIKQFYKNQIGLADFEDFDVTEVPQEDWGEQYILDPEAHEPEEPVEGDKNTYHAEYKIMFTFLEYSKTVKEGEHEIIATTDF